MSGSQGDRLSHLGCPVSHVRDRLRRGGLRPTRQRLSLGWLLFGKGDRHVTAEMLLEEARQARINVTVATVYNTLNQFTAAGMLRQIAVDGRRTYFDTNTSDHNHFLVEETEELVDIPEAMMRVDGLPAALEGYQVERVDVIVRLRKRS